MCVVSFDVGVKFRGYYLLVAQLGVEPIALGRAYGYIPHFLITVGDVIRKGLLDHRPRSIIEGYSCGVAHLFLVIKHAISAPI